MTRRWRRYGLWLLALPVVASLAGVAAGQGLDPSRLTDAPPVVQGIGWFVVVVAFGGLVCYHFEAFVDRAVDSSMDRPHVSVVYGLLAYAILGVVGFLVLNWLAQLGLSGTSLVDAGVVVLLVASLLLVGLGFAVLGAALTDLRGDRRPWTGLVVWAALSAVGVALFSPVPVLLASLLLTALGIGGPTREWVHESRSLPAEAKS